MGEQLDRTDGKPAAPSDRFCDLVMKGGITSGIVYPPAICALAEKYHFKSIGGTSAGAIAAAVTAAAEYRRRTTGSMEGFRLLAALPSELGETDSRGRTRLLRLFQPDPSCRRLFGILAGSLNAKGTIRRVIKVLASSITSYWLASLLSVIACFLIGYLHSILSGLLFLVISLPALVGISIYRDTTRSLVHNGYGMCKGKTTAQSGEPALTPWLHKLIQDAAGLPLDEPLTFCHLWNAAPTSTTAHAAPTQPVPPGGKAIELKMFTTNLAHGRPYIFPHTEQTARLFFKSDELSEYLPDEVLRWLDEHAVPYEPSTKQPKSDPPKALAEELHLKEIPCPEKFPILLAARMSLSFPILFAAVPLWAIDYEYPREDRTFKRCMFSDGGISSNFPMHLFDGLIPQWPTFGINLEPKLPGHVDPTFLPDTYLGGIADRWARFDELDRAPSRMGGFLGSIVNTMQNWNDNMLSRMPGVRDRVVRVRLDKTEGGLNLNMPDWLIKRIADRGLLAAQQLMRRFLGPAPGSGWDGWSFQRWVRLDVLLSALTQKVAGMHRALGSSVLHSQSYKQLVALSTTSTPPGHEAPLNPAQTQALDALVDALDELTVAFGASAPAYPNDPLPEPDLRARPPL